MNGLVRGVTWAGLMCASATALAGSVAYSVGPSGDYKSIHEAITAAGDNTVTISVSAGTYDENITLKSGDTLKGLETARTFLKAVNSNSPVISANCTTKCRISRFTFIGPAIGIRAGSGSVVSIDSNVFNLSSDGTAVDVATAGDTSLVSNNTFYSNKLALSRGATSISVQNNIFVSNSTAISDTHGAGGVDYNLFYLNKADGQVGTNKVEGNPLFVSPLDRDFHLKDKSPAINAGGLADTDIIDTSRADLGAYGGANADPTPYPVQNVEIRDEPAPSGSLNFSVTVSWDLNESYLIKSYKANYELTGSVNSDVFLGVQPPTTASKSKQDVARGFSLSGTAVATDEVVAQPVLGTIVPRSEGLTLTWSAVRNATRYEVRYGIDKVPLDTIEKTPIKVGNVTSYTLMGLQNKTIYRVWVVAVKQPLLRVTINALDGASSPNMSGDSAEATKALGVPIQSVESNSEVGIPEVIVAFPELPNEGCFIATAAYGSYSAAQVKTLRDFRDHYLLTNTPGRAFVNWYYANSPPAARYLNQHPALKPVVRGLLLPFVFITSWMNSSTMEMQMGVVVFAIGLLGLGIYWRRRTSWA